MTSTDDFAIVAAFAHGDLLGNPAGVVQPSGARRSDWMQRVASELGQPATAFIDANTAPVGLRWFTPITELPLCGHGTLAAGAVVLAATAEDSIGFDTPGGPVVVRRDAERFELDFPMRSYRPSADRTVADALGVSAVAVGAAGDDWLVEVASVREVMDCTPDLPLVAGLARSVVVTAAGGDGADVTSRVFAPAIGIPEDQVTGSAHCGLATWWQPRLGNTLNAVQASPRGGRLRVRTVNGRVYLAGKAVIVADGQLRI
jgi:PhzF family phenazine biosynthesis protein